MPAHDHYTYEHGSTGFAAHPDGSAAATGHC